MRKVDEVDWGCKECDTELRDHYFESTRFGVWVYDCPECGDIDMEIWSSSKKP